MALLDDAGGGGFAPSEPAQSNFQPLPLPPVQLPNFLGQLGGLGNLLSQAPGQVGQAFGQASRAAWDNTVTPLQQGQQSLTPYIDKAASSVGNAYQSYQSKLDQSYKDYGPVGAVGGMASPLAEPAANLIGAVGGQADQGLQRLATMTQPAPGQRGDKVQQSAHLAATLLQGPAHLLEDAPGIEQDLFKSFQEGLSTTISNDPNAEQKNRDAGTLLLNSVGKVSNDIFDPKVMHNAIRDSMMSNGTDEATANTAADYLAGPIATIASFAAPGGMGKVMLAQFVGQLISDPGSALHSFTDLNPSDPNQPQTTGDFVHLFGKTWAWMNGKSDAPNADEFNKGFNALAYDVGLGFMGLHSAREGGKSVMDTRSSFIRGLQGQDPSGAKEVIQGGNANLGQTDQTGTTSQVSETSQAPPAGASSSPETPGGITEGSRQAIEQQLQGASLSTARADQVPQGAGFPETDTQPVSANLSPDLGPNRPRQAGNFGVSGEGLNDHSVALVNQVAQHLQQAGLGDVVNNLHVVHGLTDSYMGAYTENMPRVIELDLKRAYVRPNPTEFLAEAQSFISNTKPEDMKPEYSDAVTNALDFVHKMIFSSPEQNLTDVASHETLHAETWARTRPYVGDAPLSSVGDDHMALAEHAIGLLNSLKNSGVGQRWLAHDSTQAAIGEQIKQIEDWAAGKYDPYFVSHADSTGAMVDDGRDPFNQFIEHFNYQLQWALGLSRHPYSLQAGDNAYSESFYNRARSDEAAQLTKQWFESTKSDAASTLQSGSAIYPTTPGGRLYAKSTPRSGGPTGPNQAGLGDSQIVQAIKDAVKAKVAQSKERVTSSGPDTKLANQAAHDSYSKAQNMRAAGIIRMITGKLTGLEMKAVRDKVSTNYIGKQVEVAGRTGEIVGAPFGKVTVQFPGENDRVSVLPSEQVKPTQSVGQQVQQELARLRDGAIQQARDEFGIGNTPTEPGNTGVDLVQKTRDFAAQRKTTGPVTASEVQRALGIAYNAASDVAAHYNKISNQGASEQLPPVKEIVNKVNQVINNAEGEKPQPGVIPEKKNVSPDWRQVAYEVSTSDAKHPLAPLRSLALATKAAFEKADAAIQAGIPADDLHKVATDLSFEVARLRGAYDLYTSAAASKIMDKEHPDFKATRIIARQIDRSDATPNEKAAMAALKSGHTLEEARKLMKDAQLGLDSTAHNWHPEFRTMLMGELGQVAKELKQKDGKPILGVHNIPMHELVITEGIDELKAARRQQVTQQFKPELQALDDEIAKAKMRKTAGDAAAPDAIKGLTKQRLALIRKQALDAARMDARIRNHPDLAQSTIANQPPLTAEDLKAAQNPDPTAAKKALEAQADITSQLSDQEIAKEAAAINGKLAAPVPNIYGMDNLIAEHRLTEDGRYADTPPIPKIAAGATVFSPDYGKRFAELRQYGGNYWRLADSLHEFHKAMTTPFDPAESNFHPSQQWKAWWDRTTVELPEHVKKIEKLLVSVAKDLQRTGEKPEDVGRRLLRPIDNLDEAERTQHLSELTPKEAAVTNALHEWWRTSGVILHDPQMGKPALQSQVDAYVPHAVLADPEGKPMLDRKGEPRTGNSIDFARNRIMAGKGGEPIFKTLDALEGAGYKVQRDISKLWAGQAGTSFHTLLIRKAMETLGENIYHSPDGEFVGYPVIHMSHMEDARQMKDFTGIQKMRNVVLGPGQRTFDMYYVHPELADYIERLSKVGWGNDPVKWTAAVGRALAGVFKFFQFSLNPSHAARVVSNMAVISSKFGVDAPLNVWNMYNRVNNAMMPADRTLLRRLNPLTHGKEDFAITQVAKAEKTLMDTRMKIANLGLNPDEPMNPDHPAAEKAAPIFDQLNKAAEALRMERDTWDNVLHSRDKSLFSELLGKGLTAPKEVVKSSDQGWIAPLNTWVPGLKQFHHWMWKDVVWNGSAGLAMHMADQHIKRVAGDADLAAEAGRQVWDGKGGAEVAEKYLTPQERDRALRQATYDAQVATGLLAKSDMSLAWQTYGRAVLISAPWTLSQLRVGRDAILGNAKIAQKMGRPDYSIASKKMVESGFGQKHAQYFDSLHTKMARRMLFGGMLKMAMTMALVQPALSWILTGQPTNILQNFQKDPTHTFDIYAGTDATGKDNWISTGFFGWQREMAEYGLSAIKAAQEGKSPYEVGTAPLVRFTNKNNPLGRLAFEEATNNQIGKWLNGWSDSSITPDPARNLGGDTDIQLLHQALTAKGVPDGGGLEDRILFALRTAAPAPSFPTPIPVKRDSNNKQVIDTQTGLPIPLYTDLRSLIGQTLNPGDFFNDPMKTAAYAMGAQETSSNSVATTQANNANNAKYQESQAQNLMRNKAMRDLNIAFQHGDFNKVAEIRDANGLTTQQVKDAITWTTSYSVSGRQVTSKGVLSGGGPTSTVKPITIGGRVLTEDEKSVYEKDLSNRQVYTEYQLAHNPYFMTATQTERAAMLNSIQALSDKYTNSEWDYKLNGTGAPPNDAQFHQLIATAIDGRSAVKQALFATPSFQQATPMEQQKMIENYSTFANTLAWGRIYGKEKGMTPADLPKIIMTSVTAEQGVKDYLGQTPFFQQAEPQDQQRMLNEYGTLTQQSTLNMYEGKLKGVMPFNIDMYVKSTVNVEESSKYLLHQSNFYQAASLATQKSLDTKYEKLSRTIATADWQQGRPVTQLSQTNQAFEIGSERTIVGHLMADQAFTDLQSQYGGAEKIASYSNELSSIQKGIRENTNAAPKTINYLVTQAKNRFLAQNPQYGAYLKARTNWERGSELGKLYSALNADDQALAAADTSQLDANSGVPDPLNQLVDNTLQSVQSPATMALDTVTDPTSVTPYVDTGGAP